MIKGLFSLFFLLSVSSHIQAFDTPTPLEKSGWTTLTPHDQLMAYLKPLADSSRKVKMSSIGTSVSGKSIPALFFSEDAVFASQRDKKLNRLRNSSCRINNRA